MTSFQKVIKYAAYVLAFIIILLIFRGLVGGLLFLGGFLGNEQTPGPLVERNISFTFENYRKIKIETKSSKLSIKNGEYFSVITNNDDVTINEDSDRVVIKDNKIYPYSFSDKLELVVVLPTYIDLEEVEITAGAGSVTIEELNTKQAKINLGAGELVVNKTKITEELKIDGGTGSMIIRHGEIKNLEANLGVGRFDATIYLKGKNRINAGIGEIRLKLLDGISNYTFDIEKGIGDIKVNKKSIQKGVNGKGPNNITISGGIGDIKISTMD